MLGQPLADGAASPRPCCPSAPARSAAAAAGRAEQVLEDPLAADHRRRARGVRRHRQDAALPEQAAAHAVRRRARRGGSGCRRRAGCRSAWRAARSGTCGPTSAGRARCGPRAGLLEEQLGLAAEGLPEVVVEVGEQPAVGRDRFEVAQVEPLAGEVASPAIASAGRRASAGPAARAPRACCSSPRSATVEQLVVGDAAPEEERQPRRQLEVADRGRPCCGATPGGSGSTRNRNCGLTRIALSAVSMPASKSRLCARLAVELQRSLEVGVGDRPPVGPAHQRREDLPRAGLLVGRRFRPRDEDPPAAGRVPGALGRRTGR